MTNDEIPKHDGMTNDEIPKHDGMTEKRGGQEARVYDLEQRTTAFAESIFVKRLPVNVVTCRLIEQVVGAVTSVGANYCEADDAVSKKDFRHKISICKREARETRFFIRMIAKAVPDFKDDARPLWQEANELHLIFAKIYRG